MGPLRAKMFKGGVVSAAMAELHVVIEPGSLVAADVGAQLRCQILDTTVADGDTAVVVDIVAELTSVDLELGEDGEIRVEQVLDLNSDHVVLTPGRDYTVAVHVDQIGDENYAAGDLLTTQTYPLPPTLITSTEAEHAESVRVTLTRI